MKVLKKGTRGSGGGGSPPVKSLTAVWREQRERLPIRIDDDDANEEPPPPPSLPAPIEDDGTTLPTHAAVRPALTRFYLKYNPEKIDGIDTILAHYVGYEIQLILHLIEKYDAVDETDLQMFAGFVSDDELLEIAGHQIKRRKVMNGDGGSSSSSSSSSAVAASPITQEAAQSPLVAVRETQPPTLNASPAQRSQPAERAPPPSVQPHQPQQPQQHQSRFAAALPDVTQFLNGWGTSVSRPAPAQSASASADRPNEMSLVPSPPSSSSSAPPSAKVHHAKPMPVDEAPSTTAVRLLESQVAALEADNESLAESVKALTHQVGKLQAENTALTAAMSGGASKHGDLQKDLAAALEREAATVRDNALLLEQFKFAEQNRQEMQSRLIQEMAMKENKQRQLVDTIKLTQRLEAQVRYLAVCAFKVLEKETVVTVPRGSARAGSRTVTNGSSNGASGDGISGGGNGTEDGDAEKTREDLLQEARLLRVKARALEASCDAGRAELCVATRQAAVADQRITEQQAAIRLLTAQLAGATAELAAASGGLGGSGGPGGPSDPHNLRRQLAEVTAELTRHKKLLALAERQLEERVGELGEAQEALAGYQDALTAARGAKDDLLRLCSDHSRGSERAAQDYVRSFSERVLLEREDVLSRLAALKDLDRELRALGTVEAQKELQRLREELFKYRRSETQKEREKIFLEQQLVEMTARVDELTALNRTRR